MECVFYQRPRIFASLRRQSLSLHLFSEIGFTINKRPKTVMNEAKYKHTAHNVILFGIGLVLYSKLLNLLLSIC